MNIQIDAVEHDGISSKLDYKVIFPLSNDTQITKTLSENEMNTLLDDITNVLGYKPIMEKFSCTLKDAKDIKHKLDKNSDCRDCDLKMKECYRCCKVCESPLEQDLLKALTRNNIDVELQLRINKDNTISHFPEPVDPKKILTLPDFYLETPEKKICIYTDGHSYHERTEYQAVRDRSIDRELQNLGYAVLRYTTSEIRQKLDDVVKNIKKAMGIIDVEDKSAHPATDDAENEPEKTNLNNGFCIRCRERISLNPAFPLCNNCYNTWADFEDYEYGENFCHICQKSFSYVNSRITYNNPVCPDCRAKYVEDFNRPDGSRCRLVRQTPSK